MTTYQLSAVQSTPITGLGTFSYLVPTTGLYTLATNLTLPWQAPGTAYATANPLAAQVQTITAVADSSGSLNDTYFEFTLPGSPQFQVSTTWYSFYYVWFNINSAGTDPAPAGGYGIQIAAATNASATTLGGDMRTQIAAALPTTGNTFTVTGSTSACILTAAQYGNCTTPVDTGTTGFTIAVGTSGSYGYASGLVTTFKHSTTVLGVLSQPSPTQPLQAGSFTVQATAGDTLSVTTASLAAADAQPNAVKGIVNIFSGIF